MEDKLFIVAWEGDGGDRESYSIFYSHLVKAKNKTEARQKFSAKFDNVSDYYFEELSPDRIIQ